MSRHPDPRRRARVLDRAQRLGRVSGRGADAVTAALLPPVARPPHDPMSLLVDGRIGWSVAESDAINATDDALRLQRAPESLRPLTEASGSFGGLRPPANVGVGEDAVWLLDVEPLRLERFDPCECRFEVVPCFGGEGSGPRELRRPHGIALSGSRLLICDTIAAGG